MRLLFSGESRPKPMDACHPGSRGLWSLGPEESQTALVSCGWAALQYMSCSHVSSAQLAQAVCPQKWLKHVKTPSLGFGLTDQIQKMVTFQPKGPGGDSRGPNRFVKRARMGNVWYVFTEYLTCFQVITPAWHQKLKRSECYLRNSKNTFKLQTLKNSVTFLPGQACKTSNVGQWAHSQASVRSLPPCAFGFPPAPPGLIAQMPELATVSPGVAAMVAHALQAPPLTTPGMPPPPPSVLAMPVRCGRPSMVPRCGGYL